jgi:ATP-dependent Clp protease protease subunit
MHWKEHLTKLYVKHNTAGKTYEDFERDMDRDYFMTAQEAVNFGLADKVIDKR